MSSHGKKMVAPIVITVIMVLYYILYFALLAALIGGIAGLLLGIIPAALGIAMICVCVQRIKEIRSGEEDDLGQY